MKPYTSLALLLFASEFVSRAQSQPSPLTQLPNVELELTRLTQIANDAGQRGDYQSAKETLNQALTLAQDSFQEADPRIGMALRNLANTHLWLGDPRTAISLYERALAIFDTNPSTTPQTTLTILNELCVALHANQQTHLSVPHLQRMMQLASRHLPEDDPSKLVIISRLILASHRAGDDTLALHQQAVRLAEQTLPPDDPRIAFHLGSLAMEHLVHGRNPSEALALAERAYAIASRSIPSDSPQILRYLTTLAQAAGATGAHYRAIQLWEPALSLQTQLDDAPDSANIVSGIVSTYFALGRPQHAIPILNREIERLNTTTGTALADLTLQLAMAYEQSGDRSAAATTYTRAFRIIETSQIDDPRTRSYYLFILAGVLAEARYYAEAQVIIEQAIAESRNLSNNDRGSLMPMTLLRAHIQVATDFAHEAAPAIRESIAFYEARGDLRAELGARLQLADALNALARHESELREYRTVMQRIERGGAPEVTGPIRDQTLAAATRLCASYSPARPVATALTLNLNSELETERSINARVATRPDLRISHDRLRMLHRDHATVLRAVPDDAEARATWRERVASLDREVDQARRALLAEVPEARALDVPLEELAGRIQLALPEDTALLTLVLTPPSPTERDAPSTYTALIVTRADGPTFVSLGDAPTLDDTARAYRDTLDGTRAGNYFRDAEALYKRLLTPLEATLGDRKTLFVVPAGPLDVVPLVALAKDRRFLLDLGFRVRYLGTAVELLRPESSTDFDDVGPPLVLAPFTGDVPHALPAAANEARSLAALLGTSPGLGPEHASADVLRHARRPRILHIATHGEFEEAPRLRRDEAFVPNASRSSLLFPSLRQGLQFQDRLSAYELSQLDFHGTQLVVLSACNSAQGAPETGQSAHGLRRAFLVAGAETVLAALWRVDDGTTDSLMRDFYQRVFLQRQSRLDALHDAMRALRACHPNPRYWAPFVLLGETRPIRGGEH